MSDKTVSEIQQAFTESTANVLGGYFDQIDRLKAQRDLEEGRYLDQLSPEQRQSTLRNEKHQKATELTEKTREAYAAEVEQFHSALAKRTEHLMERLFKVEDAGALSRAALATDAELGVLSELATRADNKELAKAVFVAAEQRGLGEHMASYFDQIDPEARELYSEWSELPPAEALERQADNVDAVLPIPDPDSLMPRAQADLVR